MAELGGDRCSRGSSGGGAAELLLYQYGDKVENCEAVPELCFGWVVSLATKYCLLTEVLCQQADEKGNLVPHYVELSVRSCHSLWLGVKVLLMVAQAAATLLLHCWVMP